MFGATSDEESFGFKKMSEFSTVDGFVEITESLAEMIKFVANEPSVGLFYIQQHTQNAVPNLINLKNNVLEKSHEMSLHTEDLEDSITTIRSMKECGFFIADELIRDINNSLAVMSTKQPKRGLINSPRWRPTTWGRNTGYSPQDGESSAGTAGYISNVFRSAKQNLKWPQLESSGPDQNTGKTTLSYPNPASSVAAMNNSSKSEAGAKEFPSSSQTAGDPHEDLDVDRSLSQHELLSLTENYEEFKAYREAKLEEWLEGMDNEDLDPVRTDSNRL